LPICTTGSKVAQSLSAGTEERTLDISVIIWALLILVILQPLMRQRILEALAATQIARALTGHKGKVTVFVPHYAMSGGTLIALAADEIVMCRHSVLGPLDPQVDGLPASSLLRVVEQKPIAEIDDETLVLADIAEKAIAQLEQTVAQLLMDHMEASRADEIAKTLTSGRWTHDYAIAADEARNLGLPVKTEMPPEVLELVALYPRPIRGVFALPVVADDDRLA
jgi:ClpP class serine protease